MHCLTIFSKKKEKWVPIYSENGLWNARQIYAHVLTIGQYYVGGALLENF